MTIKEIRKNRGYSQKELARLLGIADCTLAHYESGIRKITLEMFLKILDVCEYKIMIIKKQKKKVPTKC